MSRRFVVEVTDGYADLPDDAASVRLEDTDFDVREVGFDDPAI